MQKHRILMTINSDVLPFTVKNLTVLMIMVNRVQGLGGLPGGIVFF